MVDVIDSFSGNYRFLSNFWYVHVIYQGFDFPTTEHAYQAAKAKHLSESLIELNLMKFDHETMTHKWLTPGQAKRWGKTVDLREDWEEIKVAVMLQLLEQKFSGGTELAKMLIDTYPRQLIEGNTWGDTFWGVCNGVGKNVLGELLMRVRFNLIFLDTE